MVKLGTREEWGARPIDLIGQKDCPFCDIEIQGEYCVWKGSHWMVLINKHPYTGNEFHVMAIPILHKEFSTDLTKEEFSELDDVHIFLKNYFKGKEYFSFTRETFSNRSIKHLHMHFVEGKLTPGIIIETLNKQK